MPPPCAGCTSKIEEAELWPQCGPAWHLWRDGHEFGRDGMTGRLRQESLHAAAGLHGYGADDVDEALELERWLRAEKLLKNGE